MFEKKTVSPNSHDTRTEEEKRIVDILEEVIKMDDVHIDIPPIRLFSMNLLHQTFSRLKLSGIKTMSVRRNLIHDIIPLDKQVVEELLELDLFDNKIKIVKNLSNMPQLVKLDLSYNQIHSLTTMSMSSLTNLKELYLVENRIREISGLSNLKELRLLELGGNRILEMSTDLSYLENLEELYLGKNEITCIKNLHKNAKLRTLSLQSNRLKSVDQGLRSNLLLQELYLSENHLTKIEGIEHLTSLTLLDYSLNPIDGLEGIDHVSTHTLHDFWISNAHISNWNDLRHLQSHSSLQTIYLEGNPLQSENSLYRERVRQLLPQLQTIDSWPLPSKMVHE